MPSIRAYLRASTADQDANRARGALESFCAEHGRQVVSWYTENESGATASRTELQRLLADAHRGDVVLVEQVDRLTRLSRTDWDSLKAAMQDAGLRVVSIDLPTSHAAMRSTEAGDGFTDRMLDAVNAMLMDMLAAVSRKDYEDRRRRQAEGIEKAQQEGRFKGRQPDLKMHGKILELRRQGNSIRKTADLLGCSPATVQRAEKRAAEGGQAS
ncbi:recombinase family protein [Cobetia marina]|uniref:recombinase family protein n=1 Tax=Cobetia marina TaxID=28258 RepID=UPI0026E114CA|nr:recombinase family protein [Cobetia marina]MDO6789253.1 recombinase family protein [Cobetia marina]